MNNQYRLEFTSNDEGFALKQTESLKKWLENEEELADAKVKQVHSPIKKGEAGGELLTVLEIILSAPLLIEFAKTIQVWLQEKSKIMTAKSPKLKLSITKPDGTKIDLDTENLGEVEKTIVKELSS